MRVEEREQVSVGRRAQRQARLVHAYASSQLSGPLVAALLALQKTAEPGDELLRFVLLSSQQQAE